MKIYLTAFLLFSVYAVASTMEFTDELKVQTCINAGSAQVFTDLDAINLEIECNQ